MTVTYIKNGSRYGVLSGLNEKYSNYKTEGYMAVVRGILGIALYTTSTHMEYDRATAEAEWWVDHVIDTVLSKEYKGM